MYVTGCPHTVRKVALLGSQRKNQDPAKEEISIVGVRSCKIDVVKLLQIQQVQLPGFSNGFQSRKFNTYNSHLLPDAVVPVSISAHFFFKTLLYNAAHDATKDFDLLFNLPAYNTARQFGAW